MRGQNLHRSRTPPAMHRPNFFVNFTFTLHITMDTTDLLPLLEQLDDNVDDLEEVLQPFLGQSLSKASKNLPVMDKAKLHVLITYTLESLIFCTSGSDFKREVC